MPGMAVPLAIGVVLGLTLAAVIVAPAMFWLPLSLSAAALAGVLVFRNLALVCPVWLVIAGLTLEMTLGDLVGPAAYQSTIAAVKAAQIGLALLCVLRYGLYPDVFNPGLAFVAMFAVGLAHGLHPDLTISGSLRSLLGSVAPFAFACSRLSPAWSRAMLRTAGWIPLVAVGAGLVLDLMGLRPVMMESGGQRLAGLGHPAFLAGVCLAAIYACLIELYRDGRSWRLLLLAANFLILVLTGARAPLACAAGVTAVTFGFVRSSAFPRRSRVLPILLAACLVPLLAVLAHDLPMVRLFNVLQGEAANLCGRELLWPSFQQAAAVSPWFGWGVGAGNAIIPADSELARMIQSWAAHNEYLRMSVEGGQVGRALLIALFVAWVIRRTRPLCRTDRLIMRLVFLAFAAHAYTDNVLIATTGCVFFAVAAAVFACEKRPSRCSPPVPLSATVRLAM